MTRDDIKELRAELCLTQAAFARLLGVSRPTITSYETNQNNIPGLMNILSRSLKTAIKRHPQGKNYLAEFAYKGLEEMLADLFKHRLEP